MLKSLKWAAERHPLRSPAFLRLWLGLSISYVGDQFTTIALLWFVLQLTGSGVAISLVLLCFQLPSMITGPLLGRLLDHGSPRRVMGIDNCARALLIGAMPVLFWAGMLHLWQISILALLAGMLSPATGVGVRVLLPQLVREAMLARANALTSASMQFAFLVGPVLAGILVAHVGGAYALLLDAGSFLLMGLLVFSLPAASPRSGPVAAAATAAAVAAVAVPAEKTRWLSGFTLLFRIREVRVLTALSVVFFFSYGPLEAALPLYSDRVLHAGAQGYGLLWTGFGVGALIGALCTGIVATHVRPGVTQPLIAILWGGFLCPLMLFHSLPLALLCLALGAFSWAPYIPIEASLFQRLVKPSLHGQVFGVRLALTTAAAPLGAVVGGLLLQYLAPGVVIGLSGIACVLAGVGAWLSPTMRGLDEKTKNAPS